MHKSDSPTTEIAPLADETNCKIVYGQEPPIYKNKIDVIVRKTCFSVVDLPRACIFYDADVNLIGCPPLSALGILFSVWCTNRGLMPKARTVLYSVYLNGTKEIHSDLKKLQIIDFLNKNIIVSKLKGMLMRTATCGGKRMSLGKRLLRNSYY